MSVTWGSMKKTVCINRKEQNAKTPQDILQRLKYQLSLIKVAKQQKCS